MDEGPGMFTTHPQNVSPPELLVGELHTAEFFVLSSLRLWARAHNRFQHEGPDWREGLHRAGVGSVGVIGFDTVCRIVTTASLRSLDIRTLHCMYLGETEARFLSLVGLLQYDRLAEAAFILRHWCPAAALRLAITPAQAFAAALRSRRLWLPAAAPRHITRPAHAVSAAQGSAPWLH